MVDYQAIIEQITPEKVIELMAKLGATEYKDSEKALIFPTICHNIDVDEASFKLYYYKDTHLFYCYSEDGAMSIFSFLKHYYETRQIQYDWYEDIYQVVLNCSAFSLDEQIIQPRYKSLKERYNLKALTPKLPEYNPGVLDCFIKTYPPEWLKEGISKEAMDKYDIRYSISQNKIIIPHYDVQNRLVGIRGRALNEWEVENIGKYAPVCVEGVWYKHPLSLNLYGLNFNKENIKKKHICYIYEAEKSVLMAESFSFSNCGIAICGSNLNKYALRILIKNCHPQEIVLCLDNEEKPGEEVYFNKLYNVCKKYSSLCNFSFIYDREGLTDKKDSPVDKGEEVFRELLRRRVKVK